MVQIAFRDYAPSSNCRVRGLLRHSGFVRCREYSKSDESLSYQKTPHARWVKTWRDLTMIILARAIQVRRALRATDSQRLNSTLASRSLIASSCAQRGFSPSLHRSNDYGFIQNSCSGRATVGNGGHTRICAMPSRSRGCSRFTILIWTLERFQLPLPECLPRLALRGACAAIGAGVAYCGDRYRSYNFAPDAFSHNHGHRHHRT